MRGSGRRTASASAAAASASTKSFCCSSPDDDDEEEEEEEEQEDDEEEDGIVCCRWSCKVLFSPAARGFSMWSSDSVFCPLLLGPDSNVVVADAASDGLFATPVRIKGEWWTVEAEGDDEEGGAEARMEAGARE